MGGRRMDSIRPGRMRMMSSRMACVVELEDRTACQCTAAGMQMAWIEGVGTVRGRERLKAAASAAAAAVASAAAAGGAAPHLHRVKSHISREVGLLMMPCREEGAVRCALRWGVPAVRSAGAAVAGRSQQPEPQPASRAAWQRPRMDLGIKLVALCCHQLTR